MAAAAVADGERNSPRSLSNSLIGERVQRPRRRRRRRRRRRCRRREKFGSRTQLLAEIARVTYHKCHRQSNVIFFTVDLSRNFIKKI